MNSEELTNKRIEVMIALLDFGLKHIQMKDIDSKERSSMFDTLSRTLTLSFETEQQAEQIRVMETQLNKIMKGKQLGRDPLDEL
jgi:hypothetical protein